MSLINNPRSPTLIQEKQNAEQSKKTYLLSTRGSVETIINHAGGCRKTHEKPKLLEKDQQIGISQVV